MWVENVSKNFPVQFVPTKRSWLCLEHFAEEIKQQTGSKVTLKANAIPTI